MVAGTFAGRRAVGAALRREERCECMAESMHGFSGSRRTQQVFQRW